MDRLDRIFQEAQNRAASEDGGPKRGLEAALARDGEDDASKRAAMSVADRVLADYERGDYFSCLGLPPPDCDDAGRPVWDVTDAAISKAYRRASLAVHPDKNPTPEAKAAFDKIVRQTEMVRSADDEIARLRDLLWEEELLKKSRILEEEREAKRLANIAEMKRQNDIVLANKRKQQAVEQAEEERLVQVMIDKFKRDDEEERQKQQAIRDAKEHYKGMISDDADAKHERYLKHLADEENLKQDDDSGEQYRLQVVREARRRLLAEHADALRGFMPKGAVSAEERDEFAL